jgi:hypothetical protein
VKKCDASLRSSPALLVLLAHLAAEVVDRVVAAEQDPVVGAQTVVVELVRAVGEALAVLPADRVVLLRRQRLGHQRVVVDGHGHQPVALEQRRDTFVARATWSAMTEPISAATVCAPFR